MNYEIAFLKALFLTVSLETISAGGLKIFFGRRFLSSVSLKRLFLCVPFASLLTLPYLWFIFPAFLKGSTYIIFSEIFAIFVESIFYRIFLTHNIKIAIFISLLTNAFSFLIAKIIF